MCLPKGSEGIRLLLHASVSSVPSFRRSGGGHESATLEFVTEKGPKKQKRSEQMQVRKFEEQFCIYTILVLRYIIS